MKTVDQLIEETKLRIEIKQAIFDNDFELAQTKQDQLDSMLNEQAEQDFDNFLCAAYFIIMLQHKPNEL